MARLLDTGLLQTLVAIADHSGFARAARHVNLSQPTVSLQMKRLEEQVSADLFVKRGRRMVFTEEGLSLVRYARRILALNHEAQAAIAGAEIAGPVRLGTLQDLTEELLSEILGQFARSHPGVRLEILVGNSQELNDALASGRLDLALVSGRPSKATPLFRRERLVWIGGDEHAISMDEPIPLVICPEPCGIRESAIALLEAKEIAWRIVFSSPSLSGIKAAVRSGLGITLRGTSFLEPGLVPLDGRWPLLPPKYFDIVLARPAKANRSTVVQALDALITNFMLGDRTPTPSRHMQRSG